MHQHHVHPPHRPRRARWRARSVAGAAVALTLGLSACGSSQPPADAGAPTSAPASGPSSSSTPTPSARPTSASDACTERALLDALPGGARMLRYTCARAGDQEWAAARVDPGNTVFFLRREGARWVGEESADVCGTASAGLPSSLLDYCGPTRSPSARPTSPSSPARPDVAPCTSKALLAALPGGATMQRFSCAPVGGTTWAAARVDPGNTVFFLTWDGRRWAAEQSSDVCGEASAGLPQELLSYCR